MELSSCIKRESNKEFLCYHLKVMNNTKEGIFLPKELLHSDLLLDKYLITTIGFGGYGVGGRTLGVQMEMLYLPPNEILEIDKKYSFASKARWVDSVCGGTLNINFIFLSDSPEVVKKIRKKKLSALSDNYLDKCKFVQMQYLPTLDSCTAR